MSKQSFQLAYPDRLLTIDGDQSSLQLVTNEKAQYQTKNVVDLCSGKNLTDVSRQGTLVLTNIRIIYTLDSDTSINMQIGYGCVQKILVGNIDSKQASDKKQIIQQDRSLVIHCTFNKSIFRFEFLPRGSKTIFELFQSLYRAYDTSKLYRKLRIRQAVTQNSLLFSDEFSEISLKDTVVLSPLSPIAVPGTLIFTNFRLFWHAQNSIQFNISAPFLDISCVQIKKQSFGKDLEPEDAVLISVGSDEKPLVLALKCMKKDIQELYDLIIGKCETSAANPLFGVKIEGDSSQNDGDNIVLFQGGDSQNFDRNAKISQIVKSVDRVSQYLESQQEDGEVFFDEELGVCFEQIKGMTREELWIL
ncbi:Basal body protein [Spironucleus salmonicida]|uniref:BBSome complex member BBS5 n=1 Tax=Spironucleus salmonicida TaxID=348837 RepID=V6LPV3_9EUKA|nr:Basal body protein [Spironucleus salmonicida]|eukprot:EST42784.1 Basal body protein [Spironucleus salmonicida]